MKTLNNILGHLLAPVWEHLSFFVVAYVLMLLPFLVFAVESVTLTQIHDAIFNAAKSGSGVAAWGINYKLTPSCPIVYAYVFCCILYVFKRWPRVAKTLKWVVLVVLGMLSITDLFCAHYFSLGISAQMVGLLFQTKTTESVEFFSTYILTWFSVLLFLGVVGGSWLIDLGCGALKKRAEKWSGGAWQLGRRVVALVALLLVCNASYMGIYSLAKCVVDGPDKDKLFMYPYDVLSKTVHSLSQFMVNTRETDTLLRTLRESDGASTSTHRSPTIVWILGESFNKHHSNLYGYYLNTNPRMAKRQSEGELFVFNDVVTPYNNTSMCVKYFLSSESALDTTLWCNKPLFPKVLRDVGYKVLWVDNQMLPSGGEESSVWNQFQSYLKHPEVEAAIYDERNCQRYEFDAELLQDWETFIPRQGEYNFVVFHLRGQHVAPDKRYPLDSEYNYFTADSIQRPDLALNQREYLAHYDNSTLYNDMVVDSIFSYFEEEDAIVVYMSDHGEEAYDYRQYAGRSYESPLTQGQVKYQFEVPMMVWCSDSYRENHPDVVEQIKASLDRPWTVDDLSHLFYDLAGVQSPYFDETRSVIHPNFKVRRRMLVQEEYYEDVMGKE